MNHATTTIADIFLLLLLLMMMMMMIKITLKLPGVLFATHHLTINSSLTSSATS